MIKISFSNVHAICTKIKIIIIRNFKLVIFCIICHMPIKLLQYGWPCSTESQLYCLFLLAVNSRFVNSLVNSDLWIVILWSKYSITFFIATMQYWQNIWQENKLFKSSFLKKINQQNNTTLSAAEDNSI